MLLLSPSVAVLGWVCRGARPDTAARCGDDAGAILCALPSALTLEPEGAGERWVVSAVAGYGWRLRWARGSRGGIISPQGRAQAGWPPTAAEAVAVNQVLLRQLAEERILDAKVLIDGGRWAYGYYVAGYAVECALKACVLARMILTGWVFQDKVKIDDCLTHEFNKLVQIAGLRDLLNDNLKASAAGGGEFVANWDMVGQWKVTSRYDAKTEKEAKELYAAIADEPHGVLRWIKNYW